jgi:type IV secretion system protein VirB11
MSVLQKLVLPGSEGLLSPLVPYFNQSDVSEILINKPGEVWVESRKGMARHTAPELTEIHLRRLFTFIANENNQVLTPEQPFLSGVTFDGSRVQLVIPPASTHYTLSIRRQTLTKLTLTDYQKSGFFDDSKTFSMKTSENALMEEGDKALLQLHQKGEWSRFIELAIELKKNILISGGTSTGKTTFLNACTSLIPHHERIITLEDTREVELPHPNQANLLAPKNGQLTMQQLVQATLRLRPDRLIMGEIRGPEILDFIGACSTGHEGSVATIHANNPRLAMMRMVQLYKQNNVPSMRDTEIRDEIESVVDIIVQLKRTADGRRATDIWFNLNDDEATDVK